MHRHALVHACAHACAFMHTLRFGHARLILVWNALFWVCKACTCLEHFVLGVQGLYLLGTLRSGCARLVLAWNTSRDSRVFKKKDRSLFFQKKTFQNSFCSNCKYKPCTPRVKCSKQVQALHTQNEVFQASTSLAHPERSVLSKYEPCVSRTSPQAEFH